MVAAAVPLGDAAQPSEIASAVPLLAEDITSYTTGSDLSKYGDLN
jgi:NAD(P)-dependent dehydrogenase (short-subunit alcohol dehydrogenase family)